MYLGELDNGLVTLYLEMVVYLHVCRLFCEEPRWGSIFLFPETKESVVRICGTRRYRRTNSLLPSSDATSRADSEEQRVFSRCSKRRASLAYSCHLHHGSASRTKIHDGGSPCLVQAR